MKKISLLAVLLAAFSASTALAQTDSTATTLQEKLDSLQNSVAVLQKKEDDRSKTEYDNAVWKRKAHLMIGFSTQKMTDADNADDMQYKSKMGFVLDWGKTFYLHKKPIANLMKVGIDWSWIDLSFAKYKSGTGIHFNANTSTGDYSDYIDGSGSYDSYYDDADMDIDADLGVYSLSAGMSVGPSFTFSPFYNTGKGLQHILAQTYFHVTPSYTGMILSTDGETELKSGYTTFFNWGINLSYKVISVGYEYRWGKSKFSTLSLDDDDEDYSGSEYSDGNEKAKIKFGTSMFYIRFNF